MSRTVGYLCPHCHKRYVEALAVDRQLKCDCGNMVYFGERWEPLAAKPNGLFARADLGRPANPPPLPPERRRWVDYGGQTHCLTQSEAEGIGLHWRDGRITVSPPKPSVLDSARECDAMLREAEMDRASRLLRNARNLNIASAIVSATAIVISIAAILRSGS